MTPALRRLTEKDLKTGTFTGRHFLFYTKIGGEMQLINVVAAGEPYEADFGKGRKQVKIPVFGYGFTGEAPLKHLYTVTNSEEENSNG